MKVKISMNLVSKFDHFGINFGSFWRLSEDIFAPLGPPGATLGSQGIPGASQHHPRSSQRRLQAPPGADLAPTWPQHDPTWSQLGTNLGPSCANLELTWGHVGPKMAQVSQLEAISRLSGGILNHTGQYSLKFTEIRSHMDPKSTLSRCVKL